MRTEDFFDSLFYKIIDDIGFLTLADQPARDDKPKLTEKQIKWLELFKKQYGGADV